MHLNESKYRVIETSGFGYNIVKMENAGILNLTPGDILIAEILLDIRTQNEEILHVLKKATVTTTPVGG